MSVLYHPRAVPAAFERPQTIFLIDVIIPPQILSGGMSGPGAVADRSFASGAMAGPVLGMPAPVVGGSTGLRVYRDHVYKKGVYVGNETGTSEPVSVAEQHFRWATVDYAMRPSDLVPRQYDGRLIDPGSLERSISLSPLDNASIATNGGTIVLANVDGALDTIMDDLSMRGCPVLIREGVAGQPWTGFSVINSLRAESWDVSLDQVEITLGDVSLAFDSNINFSEYTGTSGINGDPELVGQMRPIALGNVFNATPILIDEVRQIYQINDGPITAVTLVKDGGMSLTLQTNVSSYAALEAMTVTAGNYATCIAVGCLRLGSIPVFQVTVDVAGRTASGFGAVTIAEKLAEEVVANAGAEVPLVLDGAAFDVMEADRNENVGWFITEPTTYREMMDRLLGSVVCFWGATREGKITVKPFDPPDPLLGTTASYDEVDLIEVDRIAMPPGYETGHRSRTVLYARNWSPIGGSDVAAAAPSKAMLAREWASYTAPATAQMRAAITPPNVETALRTALGAQRTGQRVQALHGQPRQMFLFTVALTTMIGLPDIGDQIRVTHPRFGLSGGRILRIVGIREEYDESNAVITAWG